MLNNSESTVLRTYDPLNMCHRSCERDYQKWYEKIDLARCKVACNNNRQYKAPEKSDDQLIQHTVTRVQRLEEDTTTLSEIQSELKNIGDSVYSLADLVSVL